MTCGLSYSPENSFLHKFVVNNFFNFIWKLPTVQPQKTDWGERIRTSAQPWKWLLTQVLIPVRLFASADRLTAFLHSFYPSTLPWSNVSVCIFSFLRGHFENRARFYELLPWGAVRLRCIYIVPGVGNYREFMSEASLCCVLLYFDCWIKLKQHKGNRSHNTKQRNNNRANEKCIVANIHVKSMAKENMSEANA